MFMIYECNVHACKLICCNAEENKSLTTGDNETLDCCQENKSLSVEDKKILGDCWRLKILDNFCGDVRILYVLKLEY